MSVAGGQPRRSHLLEGGARRRHCTRRGHGLPGRRRRRERSAWLVRSLLLRAEGMMRRLAAIACALAFTVQFGACGRITRNVRVVADRPASVNELWQEPSDIQRRDLFHGPGGFQLMPRGAAFTFVARDTS